MLNKIMKSLANTLEVRTFTPNENGIYEIEVDQFNVEVKQHSSWILWETELPFHFDKDLDYQSEQMLKRCMQLSLKTVRDGQETLTLNKEQRLVLQGKAPFDQMSSVIFPSLLSQHVNMCEYYSEILEHERVNRTINHTVWLP
ncbi:YscB family type III secretion system chaperone [Vibrio europaeus]|uniref:YscB family type III secretion system chaperone n=1 Tax=Vibrio europaeus TaxID=300876 RepID=A0AAE7AWA8_9VIBR|nr:YscB family type III secretion system chaperone [Vibrio europaeus]MDC5807053.1 YscB family type III secretion system chaperone [Vibrio europaeus]MDC5809648.1 YscB family type III secretion system chaperone [Vibrio europaeus]MDC5827578.1 YscB family type III secretion system chaperone [Vibrio europaeus]MDC5830422.1 YscB family type III secretion system chaperone [Vibrio europaeus]MDC5837278.1 YscB family type III secretion system chaperone [Vibrio europaeus]